MNYITEEPVQVQVTRRKHYITMGGADTLQDLVDKLREKDLQLDSLTLDQIEGPADGIDIYNLVLHEEHSELLF